MSVQTSPLDVLSARRLSTMAGRLRCAEVESLNHIDLRTVLLFALSPNSERFGNGELLSKACQLDNNSF